MNFLDGILEAPDRVRLGKVAVACPPQDGLAAGTGVRVSIRPEDVRVRDLPADAPNRLTVTGAELDFVGAFCRASLQAGGITLMADFSRNLIRDLGVTVGALPDAA